MKASSAVIATLICAAFLSGCGTLQSGGVYGGDTVLYHADLVTTQGYSVLHSFVTFEYQNHSRLQKDAPKIVKLADSIRANAPQWFATISTLRAAYVANPTSTNAGKLTQALSVVQAAVNEATSYLLAQGSSSSANGASAATQQPQTGN